MDKKLLRTDKPEWMTRPWPERIPMIFALIAVVGLLVMSIGVMLFIVLLLGDCLVNALVGGATSGTGGEALNSAVTPVLHVLCRVLHLAFLTTLGSSCISVVALSISLYRDR